MLSFDIKDARALAPQLNDRAQWQQALALPDPLDFTPLPKPANLPPLLARRLASGDRPAVGLGLEFLTDHPETDAIVFASRHSELERNHALLQALARHEEVSPNAFALSVHNAAVANLTIQSGKPLFSTSLSAGVDSFHAALQEACALLNTDYKHVLLVDFDGQVPEFYREFMPDGTPCYPYAAALLLQRGTSFEVDCTQVGNALNDQVRPKPPQALQFYLNYLKDARTFDIQGEQGIWHWHQKDSAA